jgi:YHS domain-containing protein
MKKLLAIALMAMFLMPLVVPQAFAAKETTPTGIVDAGNKLCPVSGDPVSGTNFVVYQGKRYGLCCPMCEKPFLSDPSKYIAKMKKQETAGGASKAAAGMKMR